MRTISLDGRWSLRFSRRLHSITSDVWRRPQDWHDWLPARVPGDVHDDLFRAGLIPDPLVSNNPERSRWLEGKDWWYRKTFAVPESFGGNRVELVFHGIDIDCDVWFNKQHVAAHKNAFRPLVLDITGKLRRGAKNEIIIRVDDGTRRMSSSKSEKYHSWVSDGRVWLRKAQCVFQWDWAPRLATCGIWRSVEIRAYDKAALRDVCLRSSVTGKKATVTATVEVDNLTGKSFTVRVNVSLSRKKKSHSASRNLRLKPGRNTVRMKIAVPDAELWWPTGAGKQALYDVRCRLATRGGALDSFHSRHGIRTVVWEEKPLGKGEKTFTLKVNGRRIFCKGANWVPADALTARVRRTTYHRLVDLAAGSNFNMLRIWGGGVYEDDEFYRYCDERGIMVWQEFMYACSLYPGDDRGFLKEARAEAEFQVKRLRNFACIVMWSGNNEIEGMAEGLKKRMKNSPDGTRFVYYGRNIFHKVLPDVCRKLDPARVYRPSSPYGGPKAYSQEQGDTHSWTVTLNCGVEKSFDYRTYAEEEGKFVSEYGYLGLPSVRTLKKFLPKDQLYVGSNDWDFHANPHDRGPLGSYIGGRIERYVGDPSKMSLGQVVQAVQFLQAEAYKFAMEYFRRREWVCSGSLYWMYNDTWPVTSGWTTIDYDGSLRPSYYTVKRAYARLLLSLADDGGGAFSAWVVSELAEPLRATLAWGVTDFHGKVLDFGEKKVLVRPDRAARIFAGRLPAGADSSNILAWAELRNSRGTILASNVLYFTMPKELNLPKARIRKLLTRAGRDAFKLTCSCSVLARMLVIDAPSEVELEDNAFDLLPGTARTIAIKGKKKAVASLRVSALNSPGGPACPPR